MAAVSAALSSLSSLSLLPSTRLSVPPTSKFSFSVTTRNPQPFLSTSSSPIVSFGTIRTKSSDATDTFFFDNVNPEEEIPFNPPQKPEDFVAPPSFDEGPMETEDEIAAAYEEIYGPVYSGVSVLGQDIHVMDSRLKKEDLFGSKETERIKDGFEERVVQVRRVTKVVKGGKQMRFRAVVVVGDKKGKVGVGVGKAREVIAAVQKSAVNARRNVIIVPLTKSLSFPNRSEGDYGAARVMLRPACPGTGVIAGGAVRVVLELAGLQNALGKQLGSDNALNNARATVVAIEKMRYIRKFAKERGVSVEELL